MKKEDNNNNIPQQTHQQVINNNNTFTNHHNINNHNQFQSNSFVFINTNTNNNNNNIPQVNRISSHMLLPFVHKNHFNQYKTFTSCSCPDLLLNKQKEDDDLFTLSLQKGFQDIINIYKESCDSIHYGKSKPKMSLQCNYYCNLSTEIMTPHELSRREYEELYEGSESESFGNGD